MWFTCLVHLRLSALARFSERQVCCLYLFIFWLGQRFLSDVAPVGPLIVFASLFSSFFDHPRYMCPQHRSRSHFWWKNSLCVSVAFLLLLRHSDLPRQLLPLSRSEVFRPGCRLWQLYQFFNRFSPWFDVYFASDHLIFVFWALNSKPKIKIGYDRDDLSL